MTPRPTVLVTGASRGIGLEVTRELAGRGMHVLAGVRSPEAAAPTLADLGDAVTLVQLDVADDASVQALTEVLDSVDGGVQAVVNNAGIAIDGWNGSILDVPLDTFRRTWETNVLGAIRVVRAAMGALRRSESAARVINVSSGMGQLSDMGGHAPAYRTSKTMLNAVTRILDAELGDRLFTASVCPGWVRTDMGGASATRSVEAGADTIVWLTLDEEPLDRSGRFWRDRAVIDF